MLHPDARALLDFIAARNLPAVHTLPPADARTFYRERRGFTQPEAPAVGAVHDTRCDGPHGDIALRVYRPIGAGATPTTAGALLPALVYYHGGGWTIGDLDTHDVLCRQLCNGSGAVVVSVDYRMGPEHRFPAAVDDALAAAYWVRRQARELGVDAARVAVGGDSAGGNLAAVVAILARDAGDLPIAYQLLIYPATDMRRGHASHQSNGSGYLLTRETIEYFRGNYVAEPAHDLDWRASPLLHPDLAGLPPALVLTAGFDPLRDEGLDYANRLVAAGSRATYVCFERQIHGFITMGKVIDEAHAAVTLCAGELARVLGR